MEDFPNAADLRKQLNYAQTTAAQTQIMDIRTRISRAVERGLASIEVTSFQPGVKERLEARGYKVTYYRGYDQRDPATWTVSW